LFPFHFTVETTSLPGGELQSTNEKGLTEASPSKALGFFLLPMPPIQSCIALFADEAKQNIPAGVLLFVVAMLAPLFR